MALKLITGPSEEPLTLTEAKSHVAVDFSDNDGLISSLIIAARQYCENATHRTFITQTWEKYLDDWPQLISLYIPGNFDYSLDSMSIYPPVFNNPSSMRLRRKNCIVLAPSVQSVSSFTYTTIDGVVNTLNPLVYEVDAISLIGRVLLAPNQSWPSDQLKSSNGICIRFICGYGAASAVPETIKLAMKLLIGLWYDHRAAAEDVRNIIQLPLGKNADAVDALLSAETVPIG